MLSRLTTATALILLLLGFHALFQLALFVQITFTPGVVIGIAIGAYFLLLGLTLAFVGSAHFATLETPRGALTAMFGVLASAASPHFPQIPDRTGPRTRPSWCQGGVFITPNEGSRVETALLFVRAGGDLDTWTIDLEDTLRLIAGRRPIANIVVTPDKLTRAREQSQWAL